MSRRASTTKPEDTFRFALVPDSADARLFVELSGYANADLSPALRALESAVRLENEGDPDTHARYLIEFAVVSYCRAFSESKARKRLVEHLDVPFEFQQVHEEVTSFRNTTVAHSQCELSTTWPVFVIDQRGEPYIRDVQAANVSQTLPLTHVKALVTLIKALVDEIDAHLAPVRERLLAVARALPVPGPSPTMPGIHKQLDDAFDPRTRRAPYPLTQTLYRHVEPAD